MLNERKMKGWLTACLQGDMSLWLHSMRTGLMLVFILLMNFMLVRSNATMIGMYGYKVHLGETLFTCLNSGFNLIMTSVAFLVMISEIPKRVSYQKYVLIRLSRGKWLLSLIVFCIGIVAFFLLFMTAMCALFSLSYVTPGSGWSDLERLAENADYIYEMQIIPQYIRGLPIGSQYRAAHDKAMTGNGDNDTSVQPQPLWKDHAMGTARQDAGR